MQLTIELTDQQIERLRQAAASLGIEPSEFARAAMADFLARPEDDFRRAAQHVLAKNRDLYERLS